MIKNTLKTIGGALWVKREQQVDVLNCTFIKFKRGEWTDESFFSFSPFTGGNWVCFLLPCQKKEEITLFSVNVLAGAKSIHGVQLYVCICMLCANANTMYKCKDFFFCNSLHSAVHLVSHTSTMCLREPASHALICCGNIQDTIEEWQLVSYVSHT